MQYIFLSHDVDWRLQGPPIEHILERKDRFEQELFENTKPENLYRNIPEYMEIEEKFDVRSTFFFRTFYENGNVLDYEDDIKQLQKLDWEIGLHTNPSSINDLDKIRLEKEKLESISGKQIIGNRVHYLNYNSELPEKLEKLGFSYDSSLRHSKNIIDEKEMGYSRINGIIEFPVTLMDAYLFTYMKIQEDGIIPEFQKTLDLGRSLSENNVISVIWHDNVLKMKGGRMYKQILEFLTSQDDVEIKRGIDLVKIFS
uniref:Putative xylanase/chitin deacetylase n=1 Tax=uncultured marine thaumarchaeote KM3_54_A10 TaxID=1456188 RepID=A0A075HDM0_9ARCH|nr:putative xylanase/chitin deacetylase [uncultured marine thaumarchaeote KM3_54_A10]